MDFDKKSDFLKYDKKELVEVVAELKSRLEKKKAELQNTRRKLQSTRKRLLRAQESVHYQRNRIIELSGDQALVPVKK